MNDDSHKDVLRILVSFDNAILWYIKAFFKRPGRQQGKEFIPWYKVLVIQSG